MPAMMHASLAEFLEDLNRAGQLARVAAEVDPHLEIAHLTDRVAKAGGPALLFEHVRGGPSIVVTNLFGAPARIASALGLQSLAELSARGEQLAEATARPTWLDRLKGSEAPTLDRFEPKAVKQGPCQQVVKLGSDVDLAALPALRCWPDESHPSINGGQLLVVDSETGTRHWHTVALPVVGRNRLALLLSPLEPAWEVVDAARQAGRDLPVAVVLGGSPVAMLLGELPLPQGVDPLALAGRWSAAPLSVVPGRTQSIEVPGSAEMILEGVILASETVDAGMAVLPSGLYQPLAGCLVLEVTAITHRNNAAFPARVFSPPPSELSALRQLAEQFLLPVAQQVAPEVVDLALPDCGGRDGWLFVALRKRYPHQPRRVAGALWALDGLARTKTIVLVDEDVNVRDTSQVLYQIATHVLPGRDVFFQHGPASLDAAAAPFPHTEKLGLDATRKLPSQGQHAPLRPATADAATAAQLASRWQQYGLDLPPP